MLKNSIFFFDLNLLFTLGNSKSTMENTNSERIGQKYSIKQKLREKCLFQAFLHVKKFNFFF
jgi:hypothetical protein